MPTTCQSARHPGQVDAVTHGHVEQPQTRLLRQVLEHLVARPLLAAIAEPGELLPEAELGPERAVVELLGHAIVVVCLLLDDQDAVPDRKAVPQPRHDRPESAGTSPPAQRGAAQRSRWPDQGEIAATSRGSVLM